MKTPSLNVGNPLSNSIFVSSPDFWASAAASADALENSLCSKNVFKGEDVSDVVRRIDFSPTISPASKSPFVSSMIKRVKNRNSEKIAKKKQKERELHLIAINNGRLVPKLNEETKRLVMKPE
ncbi:hypothetical protein ZOSMA_71G00570 [Zostera marina]|uniref:Uncharacterized protein n=1 Tax=Zostera marina TaxID=29655 RepID=A0A0K9NSC4_ZOSMR|nr:hypothetical protein ZOSMA_71G00570 [Zostera marina]